MREKSESYREEGSQSPSHVVSVDISESDAATRGIVHGSRKRYAMIGEITTETLPDLPEYLRPQAPATDADDPELAAAIAASLEPHTSQSLPDVPLPAGAAFLPFALSPGPVGAEAAASAIPLPASPTAHGRNDSQPPPQGDGFARRAIGHVYDPTNPDDDELYH